MLGKNLPTETKTKVTSTPISISVEVSVLDSIFLKEGSISEPIYLLDLLRSLTVLVGLGVSDLVISQVLAKSNHPDKGLDVSSAGDEITGLRDNELVKRTSTLVVSEAKQDQERRSTRLLS